MILLKSLLTESKQSIVNLGFPELIAKLFYKKFGKNAFIVARWFFQYYNGTGINLNDWWRDRFAGFGKIKTADLVDLYNSTRSHEEYIKMLDKLGLSNDLRDGEYYDEGYLVNQREEILREIEDKFFGEVFFSYFNLMNDLMSGKLKDIKSYENKEFNDAAIAYDRKRIFRDLSPLKTYDDGFKWINVGPKSYLIGHFMKNCGSTGVMSPDPDRTMLALFDSNDNPHAIVTYSPNEKRISGIQGGASSEVKPEYQPYVVDLTNVLNVNLDVSRCNNKFLILKYVFQHAASSIEPIPKLSTDYEQYFKLRINKKLYYSNGNMIVSRDDLKKIIALIKSKAVKLEYKRGNMIQNIFNHYNAEVLKHYIQYGHVTSDPKNPYIVRQ